MISALGLWNLVGATPQGSKNREIDLKTLDFDLQNDRFGPIFEFFQIIIETPQQGFKTVLRSKSDRNRCPTDIAVCTLPVTATAKFL